MFFSRGSGPVFTFLRCECTLEGSSIKLTIIFSVVGWGVITVFQGIVHNFAGLAACRFFLGMFEAGLFPGCQFYLSCWVSSIMLYTILPTM